MSNVVSTKLWMKRRGAARWVSPFAAAVWVAASWAGAVARADEVPAKPKLVVEHTEIDLGPREPAPSFEFVFRLKNVGTAPLKITDAKTSCGCTVARFDSEILPGGTGAVTATLSTGLAYGSVGKQVTVFSNDPERPTLLLTLKVTLRALSEATPSPDLVFPMRLGKGAEQVVTIHSFEPAPLQISKVESSVPYVKAELLPGETTSGGPGSDSGSQQSVRVSVLPSAPTQSFDATITVESNNRSRPQFELHVRGYPVDALNASPPRPYFDHISASPSALSPVERVVTLMKKEGTFKLLGIDADPALHVIPVEDTSGHFCELLIRYLGGWKPGPVTGAIVVKTSDRAQPRLEIPYVGEIAP